MKRNISHRRRLLKKSICRSPHQRNRNSSISNEIERYNKPSIVKNKNEPLVNNKRKKSAAGYKMAYRYKYYKMNNGDEEELEEDDSS